MRRWLEGFLGNGFVFSRKDAKVIAAEKKTFFNLIPQRRKGSCGTGRFPCGNGRQFLAADTQVFFLLAIKARRHKGFLRKQNSIHINTF